MEERIQKRVSRDVWHTLLTKHTDRIDTQSLKAALSDVREKESVERGRKHYSQLVALLDSLDAELADELSKAEIDFELVEGCICIDTKRKPSNELQTKISQILSLLAPWRKGPFNILGSIIDSEWNGDRKWQRLNSIIDGRELCTGKNVLDIGCNNHYYGFRMLEAGAELVLGIDPMPRYALYAEFFRALFPSLQLYFEMWGVDDCALLSESFDTVFCMGVLYHRRNPLAMLENIRMCMKRDAHLVIETICLNNYSQYCLVPSDRYQKSKGYWFIPSVEVLCTWLHRSGFEVVKKDEPVKTDAEEQKKTDWIRGESLSSFLDEENTDLTVEGYPAPHRIIVVAKRRY